MVDPERLIFSDVGLTGPADDSDNHDLQPGDRTMSDNQPRHLQIIDECHADETAGNQTPEISDAVDQMLLDRMTDNHVTYLGDDDDNA